MKKDSEIRSSSHTKYRCQYHIVAFDFFMLKSVCRKRAYGIGQKYGFGNDARSG